MPSFVYHAQLEPGDEGGIVVTFPDVPEAITQGDDEVDARAKHRGGDLFPIYVRPEDAAKLALLDAWRQLGITKSELARRIGKDEKEVRRMLDPMHATKLPTLEAALRSLGRRLVIGVEAA